ncbi:MAG: signal peptide peptidase SppA [Planctomycetota bacterium]|nr:MAG: signal peptide peptidase SppA [Planctomycetota bacterium]
MGSRPYTSVVFALAGAVLLPWLASGCIYAPFDLGLERLGELVEVPLIRGEGEGKILLLRLDGEITEHAQDEGLLGSRPSPVSRVRDELELARQDRDVRGIVLRINSPGGGVTASDLIYHELVRWRAETGRPIVAYFMDTAASGAYYVAQAADWVVASPTAITGSIGVVAFFPNVSGLGEKLGVQVHTLRSGAHKDLGNPFRPMEQQERQLLQQLVDALHERFVEVVARGRAPGPARAGLDREAVQRLADGRVFTAQQALDLGLVDEIGYFEAARAACERLAQAPDASVIVYERTALAAERPTIYSEARAGLPAAARGGGSTAAGAAPSAGAVLHLEWSAGRAARWPRLEYRWIPALQ